MAKKATAKKAVDLTPEQKLKRDWPKKHKDLSPYITNTGAMRTGLKPSEQKRAQDIRKSYGFTK